jgi:hypothetical protein
MESRNITNHSKAVISIDYSVEITAFLLTLSLIRYNFDLLNCWILHLPQCPGNSGIRKSKGIEDQKKLKDGLLVFYNRHLK